MCTAITYTTKDHYFGRTLDLERTYEERVTVTLRNHEFKFRKVGSIKRHYAMIGMATVVDGYPLYYEAANEEGLAMAALNFPENAYYAPVAEEKDNIAGITQASTETWTYVVSDGGNTLTRNEAYPATDDWHPTYKKQ